MFNQQLMELVRDSGQQTVVENPDVPNEQNEAVMEEASSSIENGMQQMLQSGGPGALKELFEGVENGDTNNPALQQVTNRFSGNLQQKFGMNAGSAKSIAISLIPVVLGKLLNKSRNADNNSGFNIRNILGSLLGGDTHPSGTDSRQDVDAQPSGIESPQGGDAQPSGTESPQGRGGILGKLSNIGTKLGLDKDGDGDTDLKDLLRLFSR